MLLKSAPQLKRVRRCVATRRVIQGSEAGWGLDKSTAWVSKQLICNDAYPGQGEEAWWGGGLTGRFPSCGPY